MGDLPLINNAKMTYFEKQDILLFLLIAIVQVETRFIVSGRDDENRSYFLSHFQRLTPNLF